MSVAHPKLRLVEAFPVRAEGRDWIALRDPTGLTENVVTVSPGAVRLLQLLDGRHDLAMLQSRLAVPADQIEKFLQQLDEALLLDSPRFLAHKAQVTEQFRKARVRAAFCAGNSYPAQANALRQMLTEHFATTTRSDDYRPPLALVAPHIDFRRGGPTFAAAYQQLAHSHPVDTFVILGVAHVPTTHRYVATRKDFQTPLGIAPTDTGFLDMLAGRLGFDLYADELVHRREHSVEFQVIYLQHVLAQPFRIVPILVGGFHDLIEAGTDPLRDREVAGFVRALRETIIESDRRVCVIAGVDLAHVGGRFGDEFHVNDELLRRLAADDQATLRQVAQLDRRQFWRDIVADTNRRRVDGVLAMYTLLAALDLRGGELLRYDQSPEPDTNSVVTFASLRFW